MKKVLIASGIAALAFATIAGAQGVVFTANLTVGSTGSEVVALQTTLMQKGYSIPAIASGAAAKGYFGSQTKSAVMAYQAANAIPNTGFVGPLTRASLNGSVTTVPGVIVCPVGYICTAQPGTTVPPVTTNPGTITTPGIEGTLSSTQSNVGVNSTVYEGDDMVAILGVKVEAKNSDIAIQRIKLDLGTDTKIYNKIYSKIYVADGSTVLASSDLNSSTVVKDGSRYFITLAGFSTVVGKNSSKILTIKADVRETIDSSDIDTETYTVSIASNGIRGVDGAGIDQYSGDTSITKTPTISSDLSDSATLSISLNSSTPKKTDVVATSGASENELDKLTLLAFDVRAEKDAVTITDLNIAIAKSGAGGATASSTVYLYEGTTELDSANVTGGVAVFNDVDFAVARDTTKTLTVKVDIRGANSTKSNFVASATSSGFTTENTKGDSVTESGSATGYQIGVTDIGAQLVLLSKSVTRSGTNNSGGTLSTSTISATFDLAITAKGADLLFGQAGSTTPAFTLGIFNSAGTALVATSTPDVVLTGIQVTSISTPMPDGSTQDLTNKSFTIPKNNTVNARVTVSFAGKSATGAVLTDQYAVGITQVAYRGEGALLTNTFMAGETAWTTEYITP